MASPASAPLFPPPARLLIRLFGPLLVLVHGAPLPPLRSRKSYWLLALLALRSRRAVERDWLAATLWPDTDQTRAAGNLRTVLSELRSALGSEGERIHSPNRHTLLLDLADADVDLAAFDAAISDKTLPALERAVALYRGPLLEGCTEEWAEQERRVREQDYLNALRMLAEGALAAGDSGTATGYFRRAIGIAPMEDAVQRGLMEALANGGDNNGALETYRSFARLLRREDPKAAPSDAMTALYTRLRSQARQQAISATKSPAETAAVPATTGYLPHPFTELIGREDECLEVAARLRHSRLVTLVGIGGIGKTRLALRVAADLVREYADGVWFVALDALTEGKQVAGQIAQVLGVKETPGKSSLESVTKFLRQKRLLLVLDNCEHLLGASAQTAGNLLHECAGVRILATSREALGITGETAWTVPPLSIPDIDHLPEKKATLRQVLMGYESVHLFTERAMAVQKSFALTGSNAPSVAKVCYRLEGIPLAIELAAARVRALTVEQIAERLDDHLSPSGPPSQLHLLTGGSRTSQSRQQTLRATLDWSYALLSDQERVLLHFLSVFAGGWSLSAAESVCAGPGMEPAHILDLLTSLVDKSLVVFEEREGAVKGEVDGRYRFLEVVRQYAAEKLAESHEAEPIRARHCDWYLALAEQVQTQSRGPNEKNRLQVIDTEHDNLRAALEWCVVTTDGAEAGLRLAGALGDYWNIRGHLSEGRRYMERALARDEGNAPSLFRARALWRADWLASSQGDDVVARALAEEALSLYRQFEDWQGIAGVLNSLGILATKQGQYSAAKALHEESLSIRRGLNDRSGIATVLANLSNVAHYQGDNEAATRLAEETLSINRELGNKGGIAAALRILGQQAHIRGDYATAQALHEESLCLRRELGMEPGVAESLSNLGAVALAREDYGAAQAFCEESLGIHRKLGARLHIARALGNIAYIAYLRGDYATATSLHQESLDLRRELGDRYGIPRMLDGLGLVARAQNDYRAALTWHRESLRFLKDSDDPEGIVNNFECISAVLLATSRTRLAVFLLGAAEALSERIGVALPPHGQANVLQWKEAAMTALGENIFTSARDAGRASPLDQAIACALDETLPATVSP